MNPQYLQQQNLLYGKQQQTLPQGEPNANYSTNGSFNLQSLQQTSQNNIADQMSNVSLTQPQKPPAMGFATSNNPNISFSQPINGMTNQNVTPQQSELKGKSGQAQPEVPAMTISQSSNSSFTRNLPFPNQQHSSQPPNSNVLPNPNIPRNNPQNITQSNQSQTSAQLSNQQPGMPFNQSEQISSQPQGMPQPSLNPPTMSKTMPPMAASKNNLSAPPVPGQNIPHPHGASQENLSRPPILGQIVTTRQPSFPNPQFGQQPVTSQNSLGPSVTGQNLSGPPMLNQNLPGQHMPNQNLHGPPMSHQNLHGPPLSNQNINGPPLSNQNLHGPPLANQNSHGQPLANQNLHGLPMSNQNFNGPPLSNQDLVKPPFQNQQIPGPPFPNQLNSRPLSTGPQSYQPQNPYANQIPGQRQYPTGPPSAESSANAPLMHQNFPGQPPLYGSPPGPYPGGMPSGPGGYQPNAQAPQGGRIDPDQMPNPISAMQDNQRTRGGDFITNQKGLIPPLVTTKFVVHDQGNSSPRFIRSSMYTVPTSSDLLKQTAVPFAVILSPMAHVEEGEYEPPIVDMGPIGPVRCIRCKAYMCPFMQFVDAGRRFQCMFCKATTEVPAEYFQHLDHTGQRMDRYDRPELMLGTFEYLATKEYCRDNSLPKPPAIIFVIDVSYNNIKSGLVQLLCAQMKNIIRNLPVDSEQTKSNMKIGFITYNNTVHFYNCKPSLAQPQMLFVGDVEDVFMPLLEGFLCNIEESESTIDSLMAQIPIMFGETRETETILGPAIQAGLEALKASECAGKLLVFHSTLPTAEAPGKLKSRDERNVIGTEKEKNVLAPQTNFYNTLGQDCVAAGCTVDLFLFNNSYIDVATIGQVCRLTGGEIYKYSYFQVNNDGDRLITDIINNINRPIAFDAVMRVRTSTGVRPTDFYGHLYMSNTTDIELASIDCDKSIAIEIKHDDKLADEEGVYIQAALLYTSCSGIRRLRIINLSLRTSSKITDLYVACDLDAIINFLLKQSVSKMVELPPKAIKDGLTSRCATILATYRKTCSSASSSGQLILPECMKILPLYINCLLKFDALTGGAGTTIDQKSYVMMAVSSMPISESVVFIYPRIFALHVADSQNTELPPRVRCTINKFADDGAYLLENGAHMFLWLGLSLNSQWVQAVFDVASVIQVDTDLTSIPILENSLNKRVRDVIANVQSERRYCMRLTITRQREKMEMAMRQFLVEDRGADGSPSYVDYLCQMHREIRSLLS